MKQKNNMDHMRQIGAIGGNATVSKYGSEYMAHIGRRGAAALWKRYKLVPFGTSDFALVERDSGKVICVRSA